MIELYLFRHGQTDSNINMRFLGSTDIPLNAIGISQVEAAVFNNIKFDAFYASPLVRTLQTAEILNRNQGLEIIKLDEIKERSFGRFDNLTVEEMQELDSAEYAAWQADAENYRITDGESSTDVLGRIKTGMNKILKLHESAANGDCDEKILVVSHLNAIRFMLSALFGFSFLQSRKFDIRNASYVKVEIENDHRVIVFGDN